jgi:hypothetical protein
MSNTTKVIDMIANEALAIAHEKATFIATVDRQYDDSFGKSGGHKTGSTLRVRSPNQYTRRQGSRVMDVQDQNEATQTITLATQDGVDMRFNSAELTLDTNNPSEVERFSKRYIEPAMAVLVSGIDADMLEQFTKDTYNLVGTAGTVVGASGDISALFNARALMNRGLAPKDSRAYQIDSYTMASIVNGKTGLFHPDTQVKKAFTEGFYGRAAGAEFYENERTYVHTNSTDHTTMTVNDTVASGDSVITLAGAAMNVGTVFTIENVLQVHPETKASYGTAQQFVVTAVNGNDYTVSPSFISTGAKQNINALPVNTAAVTAHGNASTAYRQNIVYHKDAFAFVTADLPIMDDAHKCIRKTMDGLSIRVWMASDIRNDELLVRLDMLYGGKTLRPEWACRISN